MEKNQQTNTQEDSRRKEPTDTTGTPAYRPVDEGDAAQQENVTERHVGGSQPQDDNETLGTP